MRYVIILPSIYQQYTNECLASMSEEVRGHVLLQDNTQNNIGVTPSWNLGVKRLYEEGADWLVLLSAAIRFTNGGDDFIKALEARPEHCVLEAAQVFGWHLIAFHRRVFDRIGLFDENMPIYFSDIDWSLRLQKGFSQPNAAWDKVDIGVEDRGMAHGIKFAGVVENPDKPIFYFVNKWGRHPGAYQLGSYETPFNEADKGIDYWPRVNFIGGGL